MEKGVLSKAGKKPSKILLDFLAEGPWLTPHGSSPATPLFHGRSLAIPLFHASGLAIPLFHASGLGTPSFPQGRKLHGPHGRLALARIRSQDPKGCGRAMPGMILTGYGFGYNKFRIT